VTKTEIYAAAFPAVLEAMASCGFPTRMGTSLDAEHIAHRVADAVYVQMIATTSREPNSQSPERKGVGNVN
jgi:hypothetical protein